MSNMEGYVQSKMAQRRDILKRMASVTLDRAAAMPWEEKNEKNVEGCKELCKQLRYVDDDLRKLYQCLGKDAFKDAPAPTIPERHIGVLTTKIGEITFCDPAKIIPSDNKPKTFRTPVAPEKPEPVKIPPTLAKLVPAATAAAIAKAPAKKVVRHQLSAEKALRLWKDQEKIREAVKKRTMTEVASDYDDEEGPINPNIIPQIVYGTWEPKRHMQYIKEKAPLRPAKKTNEQRIEFEKRMRDANQ